MNNNQSGDQIRPRFARSQGDKYVTYSNPQSYNGGSRKRKFKRQYSSFGDNISFRRNNQSREFFSAGTELNSLDERDIRLQQYGEYRQDYKRANLGDRASTRALSNSRRSSEAGSISSTKPGYGVSKSADSNMSTGTEPFMGIGKNVSPNTSPKLDINTGTSERNLKVKEIINANTKQNIGPNTKTKGDVNMQKTAKSSIKQIIKPNKNTQAELKPEPNVTKVNTNASTNSTTGINILGRGAQLSKSDAISSRAMLNGSVIETAPSVSSAENVPKQDDATITKAISDIDAQLKKKAIMYKSLLVKHPTDPVIDAIESLRRLGYGYQQILDDSGCDPIFLEQLFWYMHIPIITKNRVPLTRKMHNIVDEPLGLNITTIKPEIELKDKGMDNMSEMGEQEDISGLDSLDNDEVQEEMSIPDEIEKLKTLEKKAAKVEVPEKKEVKRKIPEKKEVKKISEKNEIKKKEVKKNQVEMNEIQRKDAITKVSSSRGHNETLEVSKNDMDDQKPKQDEDNAAKPNASSTVQKNKESASDISEMHVSTSFNNTKWMNNMILELSDDDLPERIGDNGGKSAAEQLAMKERDIEKLRSYIVQLEERKKKKQNLDEKKAKEESKPMSAEDYKNARLEALREEIAVKQQKLEEANEFCLSLDNSITVQMQRISDQQEQLRKTLNEIEQRQEEISRCEKELQALEKRPEKKDDKTVNVDESNPAEKILESVVSRESSRGPRSKKRKVASREVVSLLAI